MFRDSAVGNLQEFFDRFRTLNVRSNDQLDALVTQAQRAVTGIGAQDLRDAGGLRQAVATQLTRVQTSLDAMLVERPPRASNPAVQPGREERVMRLASSNLPTVEGPTIYSEEIPLETIGRPRIFRGKIETRWPRTAPISDLRWPADIRSPPWGDGGRSPFACRDLVGRVRPEVASGSRSSTGSCPGADLSWRERLISRGLVEALGNVIIGPRFPSRHARRSWPCEMVGAHLPMRTRP